MTPGALRRLSTTKMSDLLGILVEVVVAVDDLAHVVVRDEDTVGGRVHMHGVANDDLARVVTGKVGETRGGNEWIGEGHTVGIVVGAIAVAQDTPVVANDRVVTGKVGETRGGNEQIGEGHSVVGAFDVVQDSGGAVVVIDVGAQAESEADNGVNAGGVNADEAMHGAVVVVVHGGRGLGQG
ncbi:hypothetical protein B0H13DRAFT_1863233 [Mycena leptocephala]|nr:hypothetical protein B0H13DRAFT_1863233 [Mycena leptocephala]